MSLAPATRLGPYEILAALGAGGMGEVYRARDTRLNRDVAIKVLPVSFSMDPERLARFEQEARASAALNHPNILAMHDIGQQDGAPYLVYELLEGQTLRERLSGTPLPVRRAVDHAVQIANGLAAAHEKGIVHRDLKPENLFITNDGRVKILDFGLAKLTQAELVPSNQSILPTRSPDTLPGLVLGTAGYMSPEQVRGQAADHRSDIFALGTILYEMLSSRRAFHGETAMDSMTAILKEDPPDLPATGDRQIPPALERIVDRCLEKNPGARFQSTRDLAFALEGLSSHSGSTPAIPGLVPDRKHSNAGWIAAAVATLALIGALPFAITHVTESTPRLRATRFTIDAPEGNVFAGNPASVPQTVSPDGRYVAFIARRANSPSLLWIRPLDALEARLLPGTEDVSNPFWSPDSRFIGFFAGGKLKKIEATGGPAQPLCDAASGEAGTWGRDGVIVFASSSGSGLSQVSELGGQPRLLTTLDESKHETFHRWPHFLPVGKRFLFLAQPGNEVRVGSLDSPKVSTLLSADSKAMYADPGFLLFARGTTLMAQPFDASRGELTGDAIPIAEDVPTNFRSGGAAFSVSDAGILTYRTGDFGRAQLTWFDRTGRPLGTVGQSTRLTDLELSPDETRATVSVHDNGIRTADLWVFDLARGLRTKLTFDGEQNASGIWSSDGNQLVFASFRKGVSGLYLKASTGSQAEELLFADPRPKFPFSWSPDGRFILYATGAQDGGSQDLWVLPLSGDRKPTPFMSTTYSEYAPRFSPDGRWVAYRSAEAGSPEIYVAPFPGPGEKVRISSSGALQGYPRWRGDGKELFYLASDQTLMAVDVNGQGSRFEAHDARPLFQTRAITGRDPFDVSRDGQRFLILSTPQLATDIPVTVVLNWAADLPISQRR